MTPGGIDDSVALRFHLMRRTRHDAYDVRHGRGILQILQRNAWPGAAIAICSVLAVVAGRAESYATAALLAVAAGIAWRLDHGRRTMADDFRRSHVWKMTAYEIVRHAARDPGGTEGHEVLAEVLRTQTSIRTMTYEDVARLLYLSSITSLRTRILILSYLQMRLLAHAERLRAEALHGTDRLDDSEMRDIRATLRRMPGRGRRPISIGTGRSDHETGRKGEQI